MTRFSLLLLLSLIMIHAQAQIVATDVLGPDRFVCDSTYTVLDAGSGNTFLWSTDDTTRTIEVHENGVYWVRITDGLGNTYTDTIDVTIRNEFIRRGDQWLFGNKGHIDHANGPGNFIDSAENFLFPNASTSISDPYGRVQLYSDGTTIYNRYGQMIDNGILSDNGQAQSTLLTTKGYSERYYYLFSIENNTLRYSIIDLHNDAAGSGAVLAKNVAIASNVSNNLTAVKTDDGFWLMTHSAVDNTFIAYDLNAPDPFASPVTSRVGDMATTQSVIKFDPYGDHLVMTGESTQLFRFNSATGEVSNAIDLNIPGSYGADFSRDAGRLFVSTHEQTRVDSVTTLPGGAVFAINMGSTGMAPDTLYKGYLNEQTTIGALQVASDGRIYVAKGANCLDAIDPTRRFGYMADAVCDDGVFNTFGLPNLPQFYFRLPPSVNFSGRSTCIGSSIEFTGFHNWQHKSYINVDFRYDMDDGSPIINTMSHLYTYADTGTYRVTCVITVNDCRPDTFTRNITVYPFPDLTHLGDSVICHGDTILLDAGNPGASYSWTSGHTTRTAEIADAQAYSVTASYGPCVRTRNFTIHHEPRPDLGPDRGPCVGDTITIQANVAASDYLWSNDQRTSSVHILNDADLWVRTQVGACTYYDTVVVRFQQRPQQTLLPTTTSCRDTVVVDAGNPGYDYAWSTGDTTRTSAITQAGAYWVDVSLQECRERFHTNVIFEGEMLITGDTLICERDEQWLVLDAGPGTNFVWSNGERTRAIHISRPGSYSVHKVNEHGCNVRDMVMIDTYCRPVVYFPTAFSPNKDGQNDVLRPIADKVLDYQFTIFNRWGEIIFESNNLDHGWDGYYRNEPVPAGTYVYTISYNGLGPDQEMLGKTRTQGQITVIR